MPLEAQKVNGSTYADPMHDELKIHLENGTIPPNTTLGKAALDNLNKAGIAVNLRPSADSGGRFTQIEAGQRSVDEIVFILSGDELEKQTIVLQSEDFELLVESNEIFAILDNLDKFHGISHQDMAGRLVDSGFGRSVVDNLEKFQNVDHADIVRRLLDAEATKDWDFSYDFTKFHRLPGDRALILLKLAGLDRIKSYLFLFTNIPEDMLVVLREEFNVPELTNMPRQWTDSEGGLHQPRATSVDRWYGDLSDTYMRGGFNRAAVGRLIRLQIESGRSADIHDASQWLSGYQIPETSLNTEAISHQFGSGNLNPDLQPIEAFRETLIDTEAESLFIEQLLSADQQLRTRLNYEGAQRELSDKGKILELFRIKPELRLSFNSLLGAETGRLTESFYDELLADSPALQQRYDEDLANGVTRRKFFKSVLAEDMTLAVEFDNRLNVVRNNMERDFYNHALADNPEMSEGVGIADQSVDNETWFYAPENQLLFRAAMERVDGVPLYKLEDFDIGLLFDCARRMTADFYRTTVFGSGSEETTYEFNVEQLLDRLDKVQERLTHDQPANPISISDTVHRLVKARLARDNYIKDTQSWLLRHISSPHDRLTKVWGDRAAALAYGTPDNAHAVEAWQVDNALRLITRERDLDGSLQARYGLTYDDVMGDDIKLTRVELMRRLSADDTLRAMAMLNKWTVKRTQDGVEDALPADSVEVEVGGEGETRNYRFEILAKTDPRGFTIGVDTYCCMNINGSAKDCIRAGYTKGNCGFVAVYDDSDNIIAQSFWFINPERPDVLVMDNIEANGGQDAKRIAEVYRRSLAGYLTTRSEIGITTVNIGTGHSDIDVSGMPKVIAVPTLSDVAFSDAYEQRQLLDLRHA